MRERRQNYTWCIRCYLLCGTSHIESIVVGITRHTDDEVEMGIPDSLRCLLDGTHLCKRRRITQSELHVF